MVSKDQRVKPWWGHRPRRARLYDHKVRWEALEFEKGKAAVAVPAMEKLPTVIETLIAAARGGELDDLLTLASKQGPFRKARKAASETTSVLSPAPLKARKV